MRYLIQLESLLQKVLMALAAFFLLAMMGLTCADIVSRQFWVPIKGVYELMGYFGALVVACALGYTQRKKDHISVDIITTLFPMPVQRFLDIVNRFVCMLFACLACWQVWRVADTLRQTGEITETLRIIYYPFTYLVSAGFGLLAFVFFVELLKAARGQE